MNNVVHSLKSFSIFEEIIEDNTKCETKEVIFEEETSEDTSLFKIPKYLETVKYF